MTGRFMLICAAVLSGSAFAPADELPSATKSAGELKGGEVVFLQVAGEAGTKLFHVMGMKEMTSGANQSPGARHELQMPAQVAQVLEDGRVRVESSLPLPKDGQGERMLTVSATLNRDQITRRVTPAGSEVYVSASPTGNVQSTRLAEETRSIDARVSELKQLKLRSWRLVEEAGGAQDE